MIKMTLSEITFEMENDSNTSFLMMRKGKAIGRVWSESIMLDKPFLPYPHDESKDGKNSIQICGFDNISEIWTCGQFGGKKDCVVSFNTKDSDYDKQRIKAYEEYVMTFFEPTVKKLKTGCETIHIGKMTKKKDMTTLKSFNEWLFHNP